MILIMILMMIITHNVTDIGPCINVSRLCVLSSAARSIEAKLGRLQVSLSLWANDVLFLTASASSYTIWKENPYSVLRVVIRRLIGVYYEETVQGFITLMRVL